MKRSKTFPGSQKPLLEGVYERNYADTGSSPRWHFCKYTKANGWLAFEDDPKTASEQFVHSSFQELPWRGLATKDGR